MNEDLLLAHMGLMLQLPPGRASLYLVKTYEKEVRSTVLGEVGARLWEHLRDHMGMSQTETHRILGIALGIPLEQARELAKELE